MFTSRQESPHFTKYIIIYENANQEDVRVVKNGDAISGYVD